MIITDIKQIDNLAEKTFGKTKGIISVDMRDYAFIKKHSESLKAIKLETSVLTEDVIRSFDEAITDAGKENVSNVLLYLKGNDSAAGIRTVTIEQLNMFIDTLNKHIEVANIIWGIGEHQSVHNGITILVIIGYCK